jgi:HlyD family secretion protein
MQAGSMKYSIHARTTTELPVETVPATKPAASPAPAGTQKEPASRKPLYFGIGIAALAIVVIGLVRLYMRGATATGPQAELATVKAEDFVKVVRLTGTTGAVHARPILTPTLEGAQLESMVLTRVAPAGAHVKKGDVLAEFDRQAQAKDALDKRAAYQDLLDQLAQKRANEDAARASDETELQQAKDAFQKARLEVSKNEIVSRIDAEKNQETLEEADATLKQLQQTFKLKREAAAADIRTVEIQADRAKQTMLYAESNASKMTLISPMDGVVVLNMIWTGGRMGEVQEGDQVRAGLPFMRVVDPSQMNVTAEVNQADYLNLHVGQHARVYLDAYPGLSFSGTLEEFTPLAHTGRFSDKVRTFSALFSIQGNNPKLMPDLSAAVDVELDSRKNALVVPVESITTDHGHAYAWVRHGSSFEKRAVTVGPHNDLDVAIESGLKPGDVIRRDATSASAQM